MKWFSKLWSSVVSSNDQQYLDEIASLKEELATCELSLDSNEEYFNEINNEMNALKETVFSLEEELDEYKEGDIHSSIDSYKEWLDENVKPTTKRYNFGTGYKEVHTIFSDSIKDEEIIRSFTKNDLGFDGSKYSSSDDLVLNFCLELSKKYPTRTYYRTDKEMYGVNEVWKVAIVTIEAILEERRFGDCDDKMVLMYSCLYYLLKDFFPQDLWRLRGFVVDLWSAGGHAMLGWVKEGVNDWIPIETTFYDDKQVTIWFKEYAIRSQMLYQIRYSFDHEHEYTRI